MLLRQTLGHGMLFLVASALLVPAAHAQTAGEFAATAAVKAAGGASATADVAIVVDRTMSQEESDKLVNAFKTGGAAALRKALVGVPPTGSVRVGSGKTTPTRLTIERPTDKGRLLTIVADEPILFLGAGVPGAKPKEGYDFAIVDLELDASGSGSGTLAPAARVTVQNGAFVVQDYASELVRLTAVKKVK